MGVRMDGCEDGWVGGWMGVRMDGWKYTWVGEWWGEM